MVDQTDTGELRARLIALEAENERLRSGKAGNEETGSQRSKGRLRAIGAVILVLIGALLAPVAVIGTWARAELVDTDRFVQTFAPLAQKPEVQSFVAKEVTSGIEQSIDIDAMVGGLFQGIAQLDLPPAAASTLPMLEGAAANGVRSVIASGVEAVTESPQFASVWEAALRETHSRAVAVIQGDPNSMLQLSDDGTLSLSLGTVISEVRTALTEQGIGFADAIPIIDRSVPLLASDSLVQLRVLYQLATTVGFWLPWVALGVLIAGVLLARNRTRALSWAGIGVAVSLALLSAGVGVGKLVFLAAVTPSIMPVATAEVVFGQLTELLASTLVALIFLFALVAVSAWLAGSSRLAVSMRGALEAGFAAIRRAADARGLGSRAVGRFVERWHSAILVLTVALGVLALFLIRPITFGAVLTTLLCVVLALCVAEMLRRPASQADEGDAVA